MDYSIQRGKRGTVRAAWRQLVDLIRYRVMEEAIRPGDKMPSMFHLAAQTGFNPNTIARAYVSLAEQGILKPGRRGYTVSLDAVDRLRSEALLQIRNSAHKLVHDAVEYGMSKEQIATMLQEVLEWRWQHPQEAQ